MSKEKQSYKSDVEILLEGTAVSWAVYTGACKSCKYLQQCEADDSFRFPDDAPCMKKKAEMSGKGARHERN
jgi:predicted metal-binding protein